MDSMDPDVRPQHLANVDNHRSPCLKKKKKTETKSKFTLAWIQSNALTIIWIWLVVLWQQSILLGSRTPFLFRLGEFGRFEIFIPI